MSHGIPCAICGWIETAHVFPAEYPQCNHPYEPEWGAPDDDEPNEQEEAA